MSYLLQDDDGQIVEPHSISAGLDYPGVGPEHSFLKEIGRAEYYSATDEEVLEAFKRLSRSQGINTSRTCSNLRRNSEKSAMISVKPQWWKRNVEVIKCIIKNNDCVNGC
ncbi:hypothetical protein NE237_015449 [Protea cynaroides]|uniref:Uncharacterized protein n=1 Tax=Protea cynaroides TaxID=273540 RepID=A0A9Q0KDT5_9MAGN|nr:hypothetical protein NE237_015449 [Protea cynaroides]